MEKLKRSRQPIRALITRTNKEARDLLTAEEKDGLLLTRKYDKLVELSNRIQVIDQNILELMLENEISDEYDNEIVTIDGYNDEIGLVRLELERELNKIGSKPSIIGSEHSHPQSRHSSKPNSGETLKRKSNDDCITCKRKFKLPKIELKKFNGKLIDWLSWWSLFERIHNDEEINPTDKFQYLIQSVEQNTRAYEIVQSFPATNVNYPKAIAALRERFGKEKMLIQVYIRELFQMGLQNLKKKSDITSLYDKLVCNIHALESLGVTLEQSTLFLYPMVESSLPDDIMITWQRSPLYEKNGIMENPPKGELDYLLQFLQQEVERNEQRSLIKSGFGTTIKELSKESSSSPAKESNIPSASSLFNGEFNGQRKNSQSRCIFCEKPHESKDCANTETWTFDDLKKSIEEKRVCFICFKPGHTSKKCRAFVKCHVCGRRHFTIMCPEIRNMNTKQEPIERTNASTNLECINNVLLKTVMVFIGNMNKKKGARILFDDGSQLSYITSSAAQAIGSVPIGQEISQNILFDGSITNIEKRNKHEILISNMIGSKKICLTVREKPKLGGMVPKIPKGVWMEELSRKGITFNDIEYGKTTAEIDIVIGSDYWGRMMTGKEELLDCGLLAKESVFGWTLSGVVPNENVADYSISMFLAEQNLKNLWSLEVIGIKDPIEKLTQTQEEEIARKLFKETVKQDSEGRYEIRLPWINEMPDIPNNKKIASQRLISTTKKLNKNNQYETYDKIIKAWIEEGFIERVKQDDNYIKCHYLPHHPIFKESLTTPVRPVFDASCKIGRNPSLNECLYKGPNCIEFLPTILMKFRMKLVGVAADIRKAFQMINVYEEDREYLRFLWWEDASQQQIIEFKHRRVVFGLICSPFLLAGVLETHLSKVPESERLTADKIRESMYVDNCVTSFDSHEEYENFKIISTNILAAAKMELRQWESTFKPNKENINAVRETKILGIIWDKKDDTLSIQIPVLENIQTFTKRDIASILHKFFDPIGFICPVLVKPKLMLQQSWKQNISWDKTLPDHLIEQFKHWSQDIHLLKEIKIPRLCKIPNTKYCELHTFTDASKDAYAAVVFLRTEKEGKIKVQLIQAKTRIAPIAKNTIPRLELLGCLIGSRLASSVIDAINLENFQSYFWCDATTAIAWIKRNDVWGTFVGNRVRRILEITKEDQWRYIPGKLNPADLPSRGCDPKELLHSKWWEGPNWLKSSKEHWPNHEYKFNEEEINEEKKRTTINMQVSERTSWFIPHFSSYSANVRVMAWIKRFCFNVKNKLSTKVLVNPKELKLSINEIRKAEVEIIKLIQSETNLRENKQIKRWTLDMTIDGAIRMRTPVTKRMDTIGFRYPYILPRNHLLVQQLIYETHVLYCHAGVQFLMSKLREKYWITQTRKTIAKVVLACKRCKRHSEKKIKVISAALPEKRVKSGEIFDTTGVDLFGHLFLKDGSKVWVVLYTCAVYRAVQLDIINSLDIPSFIQSLKRFIYQHGRPNTMMSDNGTNFTGTARLLKTIDEAKFKEECDVHKIKWNFIPPAAPWWGGFWERMVRAIKDPLRKTLGKSVVNEDQLRTLLMEIVAVVNDRPLTTVTEDPNDLDPLTPAMFIRGTKNTTFPEEGEITSQALQNQWRHMKNLKESLQGRFRREYLGHLVEHTKDSNKFRQADISVDDVVLIEVNNKKRIEWPMGRILELMPDSDGVSRVARIRTKNGCITRALQRLYPLEMSKPQEKPESTLGVLKKKVTEPEEKNMEEIIELNTRSGRRIKKPNRYGWNN